jgi:hypothetical protein
MKLDRKKLEEKLMEFPEQNSNDWYEKFTDYVYQNNPNLYNEACDYADDEEYELTCCGDEVKGWVEDYRICPTCKEHI